MEYVQQVFEWLPTVKIYLGMGISVNLLQIILFPLICKVVKIAFSVVGGNIDVSLGRSVQQDGDINTYDDDSTGNYAQVGKKVYYIPNNDGYTNHE